MLRYISLILLATTTASSATPEDQARAVLAQWKAAWEAKDVNAASRLLAKDRVIIMTEPAGGKRARFFTRESYLKLLKSVSRRSSQLHRKRLRTLFLLPTLETVCHG